LEGVEVIEYVRKLVGSTEPKTAAPWTIRGDYAHMSFAYAQAVWIGVPNLIHASGDEEEAEKEIAHRFSEQEIHSYDSLHSKFTR
jgi:nucleoside-diphosphate kinase